MKKITLLLSFLIVALISFAQTPNQFKYQAVIRNASGDILANTPVSVQIDIIETEVAGTVVFTEIHSSTTTANGLINLNIGSVEDMSGIDWSADDYFIKVTVNGVEMGTSQLLSVPFAMHALDADYADDAAHANYADDATYATGAGVFSEMVTLTGVTGSASSYASISYPAGYTQNNCLVVAAGVEATVGSALSWRGLGTSVVGTDGTLYVSLSPSSIFIYYPDHDNYKSKNFKIVLMKME